MGGERAGQLFVEEEPIEPFLEDKFLSLKMLYIYIYILYKKPKIAFEGIPRQFSG